MRNLLDFQYYIKKELLKKEGPINLEKNFWLKNPKNLSKD